MKTFKCNFGKTQAKVIVSDNPPEEGSSHILEVEWSGEMTPKVIRPYIGWMNGINQRLADEWGVKLMHIYQLKPGWEDVEIWTYEPDGKPKKT